MYKVKQALLQGLEVAIEAGIAVLIGSHTFAYVDWMIVLTSAGFAGLIAFLVKLQKLIRSEG